MKDYTRVPKCFFWYQRHQWVPDPDGVTICARCGKLRNPRALPLQRKTV